MLTVGITGGTGLIGKHLGALLVQKGHKVVIFSRSKDHKPAPDLTYAYWNPAANECDKDSLQKLDAVVNLAGAGLAEKRWTAKRKKEIIDSRVLGTQFLLSQLQMHAPICRTFIGASAIGYYGADGNNTASFTEEMSPANDFLSNVCSQWEQAEKEAQNFLRTVIFRIGIVLGKESGAYAEFAKPVSMGVVPILGNGKQIISWIQIEDLCRMMLFALEQEKMNGIYNTVAPAPVSNKVLMKTIAKEKGGMRIPVPVPAFVLKIMLGEMSGEVLKSATVSANKILHEGFTFKYNTVTEAVHALES